MRAPWLIVAMAITASVVTSCSGVPSSSSPQVVRSIPNGVAPSPANTITPAPGSDPYTIVTDFLHANVGSDTNHTAARAFLTADARSNWTVTTLTVVNSVQVSLPDPTTNTVTVTAVPIGSVDQRGVYTPSLQGDGSTGTPVPYSFGMQKVNGQWRIAKLASGLIVSRADFQQQYVARKIYFLDSAQRKVVPDLRYSALTGQPLCTWLLDQLLNGPPSELGAAVSSDLPAQTTKAGATCAGRTVVVDLPGISQSSGQTLQRLAAQLAFTFDIESEPLVSIVDGTRAVIVPGISGPFTSASFVTFASDGVPPALFYLHSGGVVDETGTPVSGPIGNTKNNLTSVALAPGSAATGNLVAGTAPVRAGVSQLVVGTTGSGLQPAPVQGALSRPTFAPGTSEVWVASGASLVRVTGTTATPVAMSGASGTVGAIKALAFSSDGVRLALVIASSDGTSEIWVGAVVRSGQDVRVDGLTQVTPPSLVLTDVAWNNPTTLYTVGYVGSPASFGIWSVQSDGSLLNARSTSNLPATPDAIAAAPDVSPWVSAGQAIWVQRQNSWSPPGAQAETTYGTAPTYLQ
jgi:hypothetical protein